VTGSGWQPGVQVQAVLCGNLFLGGIGDCDPTRANTTVVTPEGTFSTQIVVGIPPKPCPCVVHVSSPENNDANDVPFEVIGAETAQPTLQITTRSIEAQQSISGIGPIASWFGAGAERTIDLEVTNTGSTSLENPDVRVTAGTGDDPTDVVARPDLGLIAPGQSVTVQIPVQFPAFTFGRLTVLTSFAGLDEPTSVSSTTSSYPWALIVIGWLLIQIPLLGLWRRKPEAAAPEDPLSRRIDDLVVPPRDFGTATVLDLIEPVGASAPNGTTAQDPLIVVGGVVPPKPPAKG
jgi:hypothetical protein